MSNRDSAWQRQLKFFRFRPIRGTHGADPEHFLVEFRFWNEVQGKAVLNALGLASTFRGVAAPLRLCGADALITLSANRVGVWVEPKHNGSNLEETDFKRALKLDQAVQESEVLAKAAWQRQPRNFHKPGPAEVDYMMGLPYPAHIRLWVGRFKLFRYVPDARPYVRGDLEEMRVEFNYRSTEELEAILKSLGIPRDFAPGVRQHECNGLKLDVAISQSTICLWIRPQGRRVRLNESDLSRVLELDRRWADTLQLAQTAWSRNTGR